MTYEAPNQTHNDDNADEASSLLTVVTASPASSSTKKKNGVPTMRALIVTTCFLLGTLAMIYSGSRGGSSSISTANLGTVAVVTSDDSCATEVPGEGPCCDGHPLYDECHQVCDWLLKCDNGYVPELTDDTATVFPETSHYQPHNCHCRGYDDHDGCFCRQVRDMIIKFSNGGVTGGCDPCLPPPPTPSPTTVYDPSHDYCFKDNNNAGKYCWYPTENYPWDPNVGLNQWTEDYRGYNDCGAKCTTIEGLPRHAIYDYDKDYCFRDTDNYDKYCFFQRDYLPVGNWIKVTGREAYENCGRVAVDLHLECTDVNYPD